MNRQSARPVHLHVITQGHWGGAQQYVFDLALAEKSTFDVHVAVGEPNTHPDLQKRLRKADITVHDILPLKRSISPIRDMLALRALRNLYKQLQPTQVHLHSSKAGILGSLARGQMKISEVVYTVHGWVFREPLPYWKRHMFRLLERWTAQCKDLFLVLNNEDEMAAHELGIPKKKIIRVEQKRTLAEDHFYDRNEARAKLSAKYDLLPDAPWIGAIANLYHTKGIDLLIDAIANSRELLNAEVVVFGEGDQRVMLERMIEENNLKHVHLVGFDEQASRYLRAFDLGILPSRKEGTPFALLEMMKANIPILASATGGIIDLAKEYEDITLIRPERPLAKQIIQVLKKRTA